MSSQMRNSRGGIGYRKKKTRRDKTVVKKEILLDVENGDGYYGKVLKLLGTNRVLVKLHNNIETQVTIPGRLYKRVWIKPDHYILVNNLMEIEKVYNDFDKDTSEVKRVFGEKTGEDSSEQITTIHKVSDLERKQEDKLRYLSRSEGRHFTNPEELEKQDKQDKQDKQNKEDSNIDDFDISQI